MQTLLFKLFDKLIRLELVEDSQILSLTTNQSQINHNLSTIESLEAIIPLKQIDKEINFKVTPGIAISHNLLVFLYLS